MMNTKVCYTLADVFLLGLCVTGSLLNVTSLFVRSGLNILLFFIILSIVLIIIFKQNYKEFLVHIRNSIKTLSCMQGILIIIVLLIFACYALMPPQLSDSFYYHIQNIIWNDQYHVVPGLANINDQFGFNSNFFLLSSTFGFNQLFGQYIYALNPFFFAFLFIFSIKKIYDLNLIQTTVQFLCCLIFFVIYRRQIGSPSTDILSNILILYLFLFLLIDPKSLYKRFLVFWMVAFYCITLKLSSLIICLLCLYLLIWFLKRKRYKVLFFLFLTALFILIPWIIRNIVITGYLIYPYPDIDIFDVDWKVPEYYVTISKDFIHAYAISVDAMYIYIDKIQELNFWDKVSIWLHEQSYIDIILVALAIISPFLFCIFCIKYTNNLVKNLSLIILWILCFIGIIFCLFLAPAVRFSLAYITISIFIPLYLLIKHLNFKDIIGSSVLYFLPKLTLFFLITMVTIISSRYIYVILDRNKPLWAILYKPQNMDNIDGYKDRQINQIELNNGIIFYKVEGCFDCQLPCSNVLRPGLEARGTTLQDGFRMK